MGFYIGYYTFQILIEASLRGTKQSVQFIRLPRRFTPRNDS